MRLAKRGVWIAGFALLASGCSEEPVALDRGHLDPSGDPLVPTASLAPSGVATVLAITELPPLPGETSSWPAAVNSSGQVVGTSGGRPVLWEDGEPRELPTLEGAQATYPLSINDVGQAVGRVRVDDGSRAVLWENGTVTDIGTLPGRTGASVGSINSAGHIIGTSGGGSEPTRGFVWRAGEMSDLPPVSGDERTSARSGNSSGLVVGTTSNIYEEPDDPRDERRFVVWQDGEIVWLQEGSSPSPAPDGNEAWLGVTEADDAYMINTDVGALWRWRDGELVPWPFSSAWSAMATAVSPGGLVLGALMEDFRPTEWGVWKDEEFFPIEGVTIGPRCGGVSVRNAGTISDAGHVICQGPDYDYPFVARLDLGDGDEDGEVDPQPSVDGVLVFFDAAVADGTLTGNGPGSSGESLRNTLREMLEEARTMIEAEADLADICGQLAQAHRRTDGVPRPPDFVSGPAAETLAGKVSALMDELGCGVMG